jgi:hypothetical protein
MEQNTKQMTTQIMNEASVSTATVEQNPLIKISKIENGDSTFFKMEKESKSSHIWKYQEDKTLKEVESYLATTYHSHYTSDRYKTQTLDLIESIGDAEAFSRSNAIKYLSRFGRKNGKSKLDLLKAIHYCVLLYHFSGIHQNKSEEYKTF